MFHESLFVGRGDWAAGHRAEPYRPPAHVVLHEVALKIRCFLATPFAVRVILRKVVHILVVSLLVCAL